MRQIFLDTETTGLDWRTGDRVVEIGCVEMVERRLTGKNYHVYLNPSRPVGDSERIHGLSDAYLADKPAYEAIAGEFEAFVADSELIIHNASFDVGFLNMEQERVGRKTVNALCPQIVDTIKVAKELWPGKKASLDALCDRYGINNSHRTLHGALLDAELLAEVYLAMTRGQESLSMDIDDRDNVNLQGFISANGERHKIKVVRASDEELEGHERVLQEIFKKGRCLWIPREPEADKPAS